MKSLFGGSLGLALLTASLFLYSSSPLAAETNDPKPQPTPVQVNQEEALTSASVPLATGSAVGMSSVESAKKDEATKIAASSAAAAEKIVPAAPPANYVATAYSLRGRGASGLGVRKGTIAADPRVLPFGTRVRLDAGPYSGEYIVTDAGTAVKGNKIDVWMPTMNEACRFGRRTVKLTVLSYGARRKASRK